MESWQTWKSYWRLELLTVTTVEIIVSVVSSVIVLLTVVMGPGTVSYSILLISGDPETSKGRTYLCDCGVFHLCHCHRWRDSAILRRSHSCVFRLLLSARF
jgi:hypothetical protein